MMSNTSSLSRVKPRTVPPYCISLCLKSKTPGKANKRGGELITLIKVWDIILTALIYRSEQGD